MTEDPASAQGLSPPSSAPWPTADEIRGRRYLTRLAKGLTGVGVALAGAAALNCFRSARAERDNPPTGRFVEIDGIRLHYVDRGAGHPLVLLHGNGAFVQDFQLSGVIAGAARQYRVIAFDRPGFGFSERPRTTVWTPAAQAKLIARALAKLGVDRSLVLGHSWGTLVALEMALQQPAKIAGLVLVSGYYFPTARPDVLLMAPPAVPLLGDVIRYTISPLAGWALAPLAFKAMFAPAKIPQSFADWPTELALRPSQIRASAAETAMMIPAAAAMQSRYEQLDLPVILVGGCEDQIADFERHSVKLHALLANSELVGVEGAGHMVHYSDPESVSRAIGRVAGLSQLSPSGESRRLVPPPATAAC